MNAREKGLLGESAAADYLRGKGYDIIERNYHSRSGEIDIIASGHGYIVFAEVKLRAERALVSGLEAVDARKMRRIYKTACRWLQEHPSELQPRFDVIQITRSESGFAFEHIEHAFGAEVCDEIF